ncbi:hypothetical protein [Winogradskya humida]|uniref:Uncharacterized protein n=1 Tax=Winogradskya humida TaxID=113566 RepID=A0ABQ3ZTF1_9ACTN|nr:hypothetical protein [Actinoplanes humidus]GIE21823.1 hypothetical protein Ahu01nite_049250 [Actinoplanes humidus]
MNDHGDQLRAAFQTRENETPDPAAVFQRVTELSRTYKRRRRGLQVTGGAVLGAGLIAGAFQLPGIIPASHNSNSSMVAPAGPGLSPAPSFSPTPSASPTPEESPASSAEDKARDAFFEAGYGYDEAVTLAKHWKISTEDIGEAKVKAGELILAHKKLPAGVKPDPAVAESMKNEKYAEAFFNAGYDFGDAAKLADTWNLKDSYDAKVMGGKKILAGEPMPFQP